MILLPSRWTREAPSSPVLPTAPVERDGRAGARGAERGVEAQQRANTRRLDAEQPPADEVRLAEVAVRGHTGVVGQRCVATARRRARDVDAQHTRGVRRRLRGEGVELAGDRVDPAARAHAGAVAVERRRVAAAARAGRAQVAVEHQRATVVVEDVEDEVVGEEHVPAVAAGAAGERARRDRRDGLARVALRVAGDRTGRDVRGGAHVGDRARRRRLGRRPAATVVDGVLDVPSLGRLGAAGLVGHAGVERRTQLAGRGAGRQQPGDTDVDGGPVVDHGVVADGDPADGDRHLGAGLAGGAFGGRIGRKDRERHDGRQGHERGADDAEAVAPPGSGGGTVGRGRSGGPTACGDAHAGSNSFDGRGRGSPGPSGPKVQLSW